MNTSDIEILKKRILYRCSYSGTKETDLIYLKLIVNKIDQLKHQELIQLSNLFKEVSDTDIFLILTNKIKPHQNYKLLFKKLMG